MTDIVSPPEDTAGRIAWARNICHHRRDYMRLVSGRAVVKMAEQILLDAGLAVPVGRSTGSRPGDNSSGNDSFDMPKGEDRVGSAWGDGGGCD